MRRKGRATYRPGALKKIDRRYLTYLTHPSLSPSAEPSYVGAPTPHGKLFFHMIAAFAQFERDNLLENTMAGLAAARARGRLRGRPRKLDEKKAAMARELAKDRNRPVKEICELLGISRATFYNYTSSR